MAFESADSSGLGDVRPTRSVNFWHDTVTLKVEHTLYKVSRDRLATGSAFFYHKFMLPQDGDEDQSEKGKSDENPIILPPEVTKRDFHQLLETLYPPTLGPRTRSKPEWISVLKIATMYDFREIRDYAIGKLGTFMGEIGPIDKVKLADEYHVSAWFLKGVVELVTSKVAFSEEDASKLHPSVCSRISREREKCRELNHRGSSSSCGQGDIHTASLKIAFSEELDEKARYNARDRELDFTDMA